MPYLETVEELAESLADMLGIYNHQLRLVNPHDEGSSHTDDCGCRKCWCGVMEERMRAAVRNEVTLTGAQHAS